MTSDGVGGRRAVKRGTPTSPPELILINKQRNQQRL
jgi:hypothetical protein